jgi:hypothetical protein
MGVPFLDIDPWPVRNAGLIAQEVALELGRLAGEVAPASELASQRGLYLGAHLRTFIPIWEEHLRALGATIDGLGSQLVTAASGLDETDFANAEDINDTTTTGTTVWPGPGS